MPWHNELILDWLIFLLANEYTFRNAMCLLQISHYFLLIDLRPCEILQQPHHTSRSMWALHFQQRIPPLEPTQSNPAPLYSCSFTPLAVFFVSFQLIPQDEILVGHFKASARGLTALDLTVSDSLLVLWSLSPGLKGLLQPIYSNPLFGVQLDQRGTQCNPKDSGGMINTGTLTW